MFDDDEDAELAPNEEANQNPILNMLFWILVSELGGSVTLDKATLQKYTTDKMGAVTFEYHDDDPDKAVTIRSLSREELLTRLLPPSTSVH